MNVSLTERIERFVERQVSSGRYRSASEFVRDCIRARMVAEAEWDARLEAIRGGAKTKEEPKRNEGKEREGREAGTDPLDVVLRHRDKIQQVVAHYGGRRVRIFGPVVRGEAKSPSQTKLLVDLGPDSMGFEKTGISWDLEWTLRGFVEVVSERELDPAALHGIESEAMEL